MSITAFTLPTPIRQRIEVAPRDFALRDQAIALFEAAQSRTDFIAAVSTTLAYLLPGCAMDDLANTPLQLIQGSARIHIAVDGESLRVRAVLIRLQAQAHNVAAMRFCLSRLGGTGQLFQPRLRGDEIALEFSEELRFLHPQKLIEVMQRLPSDADNNDTALEQLFGVQSVDRQPPVPLGDEQFAAALAIWQQHWDEVDALMLESRRRRQVSVLDSLGSIAINHLVYTLPLMGPVRARLTECADEFTNREESATKRDNELAKCIREMRAVTPEQLRACLGHVSYAVNPLNEGTPALLSAVLGGGSRMQKTGEHRAVGRALEATLELIADYLYLLAHHSWPSTIDSALRSGLESASAKPWREAADLLWNHANATAKAFGNHSEGAMDDEQDEHDGDAGADFDQDIEPDARIMLNPLELCS